MVGIRAHAKTSQFCIYLCATAFGMFQFFQNQYSGTFTKYKTIPGCIPRTAGSSRIIIAD